MNSTTQIAPALWDAILNAQSTGAELPRIAGLRISIPQAGQIRVEAVDADGRELIRIADTSQGEGDTLTLLGLDRAISVIVQKS